MVDKVKYYTSNEFGELFTKYIGDSPKDILVAASKLAGKLNLAAISAFRHIESLREGYLFAALGCTIPLRSKISLRSPC